MQLKSETKRFTSKTRVIFNICRKMNDAKKRAYKFLLALTFLTLRKRVRIERRQ